jgi:hypothetical protein
MEFKILFEAIGTCFGCIDETHLLAVDDGPPLLRRLSRLPSKSRGSPPRQRRLIRDSGCFCKGGTIANQAPTFEEFDKELEEGLEEAQDSNICGVGAEDSPPTNSGADPPMDPPPEAPEESPESGSGGGAEDGSEGGSARGPAPGGSPSEPPPPPLPTVKSTPKPAPVPPMP